MENTPSVKVVFEDWHYTFTLRDETGFVVTDGKDLDELYKNIKEALDLHYQDSSYTLDITTPIRLSVNNHTYATHV